MSKERLFVYGTLCPGRPNEHWLKDIGGTFTKAKVNGKLHSEGWGATMGYPAIVLDDTGGEVEGYVFESENLLQNWTKLDEFEGEEYQRVKAQVILESGDLCRAYVYELKKDFHHLS